MLIFMLFLISSAFGQISETVAHLEIDLGKKCQEQIQKSQAKIQEAEADGNPTHCAPTVSSAVDNLAMDLGEILSNNPVEAFDACKSLGDFSGLEPAPMKIDLPGEEKPKKNIIVRFTNGLKTVPHDVNTKMKFVSPEGITTTRDFVMKYDTRWHHLNPKNWKNLESAFYPFHESTWGYQIDVLIEGKDKKRTGLSLFFDHPKWKGAMAESKNEPGKLKSVPIIENRNFGDTSAYEPGSTVYHIQNSHMNLIGGLKVSRDIWVKEFKNGDRLSYGVHAGAGVNMGVSRTLQVQVPDEEDPGYWNVKIAEPKLTGWTVMAGHAVEYQKGKVAATLTHTLQYTQTKQEYVDGGYVKYGLPQSALALTISVNVFDQQRKAAKRAKKNK